MLDDHRGHLAARLVALRGKVEMRRQKPGSNDLSDNMSVPVAYDRRLAALVGIVDRAFESGRHRPGPHPGAERGIDAEMGGEHLALPLDRGPIRLPGSGSAASPADVPAAHRQRRWPHRARVRPGSRPHRPAHPLAAGESDAQVRRRMQDPPQGSETHHSGRTRADGRLHGPLRGGIRPSGHLRPGRDAERGREGVLSEGIGGRRRGSGLGDAGPELLAIVEVKGATRRQREEPFGSGEAHRRARTPPANPQGGRAETIRVPGGGSHRRLWPHRDSAGWQIARPRCLVPLALLVASRTSVVRNCGRLARDASDQDRH